MPVPPAELSAHFAIAGPPEAQDAASAVAGPSGIAHDGGPGETLVEVLVAALDARAHRIDVRIEAPTESR